MNDFGTYVELQTYSNYSFLRGASHPEEFVEQAAALGYRAIGVSDYHSMAGIVRAHSAAKKHNITLISGTRISLFEHIPVNDSEIDSIKEPVEAQAQQYRKYVLPLSVLLYPASRKAYGRLCSILTKGKLRAPKGRCFLTLDDVRDAHQGLHCVVLIHDIRHVRLLEYLRILKKTFDHDRLSLAISQTYGPEALQHMQRLSDLGALTSTPLLASNEVQYHNVQRRMLHDVLCCIRKRCTLEQAGFSLLQNAERFLKPPEEMLRLFKHYPQAIRRSVLLAQILSQFSLDQLQYEYPHEICPDDKPPMQYLRELVAQHAPRLYPEGIPPTVRAQIKHELTLIDELNYAKYFLTVYDIVQFARANKILCQGRGAAANSAVCYVLGITAVDPGKINLLFERFISKERNEPPDIDIDFEHERREEVIQYIYQKYDRHRAALAAAIITYRTKSAVRDVGKVLGLAEEDITSTIKLLTRSQEDVLTAEHFHARNLDPHNKALRHTIKLVNIIRGFPRHLSQHVGGFIISEQPLSEIVPIENAAMVDRTVIEWDKDDIDALGMLKIDILALGMLTMIRKAFNLVNDHLPRNQQLPEHLLQLHRIPPEDPAVYDMICRADTIGVFQIESRAQQSMLPRLKPRCFYDLVIEVAIVRPGPIQGGMVHPYLKRRQGLEQFEYPNDEIKRILEPTLGVPIFQEQVMELAVAAAGCTRGEADQIRRAMASWKRNKNALGVFGKKLIDGMRANGYPLEFAQRIFEQIKGFGEYGFPQSHAASFALLVYVSAWLKCHHHAAFTAALLNSQPMGFYRPGQLIADAKAHGITILEIDVLASKWDCTLERTANSSSLALRLGMRLVKGLREHDAEAIYRAAKQYVSGTSLTELWRKSGTRADAFRRLAKADAFGSLGIKRQQAIWEAGKLRDEVLPLFERVSEEKAEEITLPAFSARSQVIKDYETTGFSLKAHPVSFLRSTLKAQSVYTASKIREDAVLLDGLRLSAAGIILLRQRPSTAAGTVFITLEDETGMCNLIIRPKIFKKFHDLLCDSIFLLAKGKLQHQSGVTHLLPDSFHDLTPQFENIDSISRDFR
jgi:error-prone DNA polymerase